MDAEIELGGGVNAESLLILVAMAMIYIPSSGFVCDGSCDM